MGNSPAQVAADAERRAPARQMPPRAPLEAPFSRDLRDALVEATNVSRAVQAQLNMLTAGQSALDARVTALDEEHVPRAERARGRRSPLARGVPPPGTRSFPPP